MSKFTYRGKDKEFARRMGFEDGGEVPDYDYAGAEAAGVKPDERGHMPDTYKLPNHMTFSTESKYSGSNGTQEGGTWSPKGGSKWDFKPGAENLKQHTATELGDYFKKVEPDSTVTYPGGPSGRD